MKVRCPVCGVEAEIDQQARRRMVFIPGPRFSFPAHTDCELAKPVESIDLDKLERVE